MAHAPHNATAERLLEAHVAFELARWSGPSGHARLVGLQDNFWYWAQHTRLGSVFDVEVVSEAAVRLLLDPVLSADLAAVIGAVVDDLIRRDVHRDTRVCDVIDQALFEDGVDLMVELETLRARLLRHLLNSPVYTALASDVLYQGIKDYIFSDAGAIRAIPGVSRLIKGSSAAVGRRLPGLEAQVEARVKAYIENNTARTLARTEALLLDSLDAERIRALAGEVWTRIADESMSVADALSAEEVRRLVDYGVQAWHSLRETEYAAALVEQTVAILFQRHGDDTVAELLGRVGLDRAALAEQVQALAPDLLADLQARGLLEAWIRQQLAPFYRSEACAAALAGAEPAAGDD